MGTQGTWERGGGGGGSRGGHSGLPKKPDRGVCATYKNQKKNLGDLHRNGKRGLRKGKRRHPEEEILTYRHRVIRDQQKGKKRETDGSLGNSKGGGKRKVKGQQRPGEKQLEKRRNKPTGDSRE